MKTPTTETIDIGPRRAAGQGTRRIRRAPTAGLGIAALGLLFLGSTAAGTQAGQGWRFSGEVSFVRTGGNAQSSTMGLAATLSRAWAPVELKLEAGGIQTTITRVTRTARGTSDDYELEESTDSERSAENYYLRTRLDWRLSERTTAFTKSDWTRNTFAGVKRRAVNTFGISTRWIQRDRWRLGSGYGATYTFQTDVVPDPEAPGSFFGLQLSADHWMRLAENAEWTSTLVMDGNGSDLPDVRGNWTNALSVAMNDRFALKTNVRLSFDNRPALASVPLVSRAGESAGTINVARRKLDRVATLALLVTL